MYFEYTSQPRALQMVVDEYTVIPVPIGDVDQTGFSGDGLVLKVTLLAKTPEKLTVAKPRPLIERIAETIAGDAGVSSTLVDPPPAVDPTANTGGQNSIAEPPPPNDPSVAGSSDPNTSTGSVNA